MPAIFKIMEPTKGTAFVISPDRAVTCWHVCEGEDVQLYEYESGSEFVGKYIESESDPENDIAVIGLDETIWKKINFEKFSLFLDVEPTSRVILKGVAGGELVVGQKYGVILRDDSPQSHNFINEPKNIKIKMPDDDCEKDNFVYSGMSGGPIICDDRVVAVIQKRNEENKHLIYGIPIKNIASLKKFCYSKGHVEIERLLRQILPSCQDEFLDADGRMKIHNKQDILGTAGKLFAQFTSAITPLGFTEEGFQGLIGQLVISRAVEFDFGTKELVRFIENQGEEITLTQAVDLIRAKNYWQHKLDWLKAHLQLKESARRLEERGKKIKILPNNSKADSAPWFKNYRN